MSDDYIRGLTQKYRLAVAIAVIKDKPQDVPIENYIKDLKSKINDDKMEDLDLTLCSDDFDMEENPTTVEIDTDKHIVNRQTNDENSITILQDHNIQFNNNDVEIRDITHMGQDRSENINMNIIEVTQATGQESRNLPSIDSQLTLCETQQSQTIFTNPNEAQTSNYDAVFKFNDVIKSNANYKDSNEVNRVNICDQTYYDSQATEVYSLHGYTQNCTHVSQSQNYGAILISDKFLKARNNIQTLNTTNNNVLDTNNIPDSFKNNANAIQFTQTNEEVNSKHITNENNILTKETDLNVNENQYSVNINEQFPHYAQDLNNIHISQNTIDNNGANSNLNDKECNKIEDKNKNDDIPSNESQIVPFKVLEELNKIKNYINKKVERRISNDGSMESGYRSDSQSKCSFRSSLQISGNWLNQSAHSLYEYITQCPLLGTTHEIIGEIAQVLGQLIDRLHEEEKYPSFLDELLENVNFLLQELFQESDEEDVLLRKDEKVQRLLLLNKSVHIQKYTIEKITTILETLLNHLTNSEETYEIANIIEMENISYIFHLLEVILQRYIKGKSILSQEMTNSQIEPKKSSITELWRKKWNPNYKEDNVIEEFTPRKCVLVKCNEILNKLVVACMDGYSLVAFAALNCFNMLQS